MDNTEDMGTLEKYLKGEPLTEGIAALKRGEESFVDAEQPHTSASGSFSVAALDDDDREHLKRMTLEAGWQVLLRLLERDIQQQENLAKAASMSDPLGDREIIANFWAYVAMLKRGRDRMVAVVDDEINRLPL